MPKQVRLLVQRTNRTQQASATSEQLLAFARQNKAAADAIEQGQAKLLLKVTDLPRKSGLSYAKVQRGFGYCPQLRYSDKCS
jgi:hypothetical protein